MIYKQEVYIKDGVSIRSKTQVVGDGADRFLGAPQFDATGVLQFQLPDGQTGSAEFKFDIPGETEAAAFANLPAALEAARVRAEEDLRNQLEAQQAAQQAPKIIVPNGHPAGPRRWADESA